MDNYLHPIDDYMMLLGLLPSSKIYHMNYNNAKLSGYISSIVARNLANNLSGKCAMRTRSIPFCF